MKSRIAPTPSGYLHLGNTFNFLLTEKLVHTAGGELMLRIDDLDAPRCRPEYLADIFESLAWLGIEPDNTNQPPEQFLQSHRLQHYEELLLRAPSCGYVFACTCSRKESARHSEDGQYSGACLYKGLPLDTAGAAWRIITPKESSAISFTDHIAGPQHIRLWDVQRHFIIRRRDGVPAYPIASLSDDIHFSISTIVRGADLLNSTAAQLYLAQVLGLSSFAETTFYHHPLIKTEHGHKLSKSAGSTSLKALRDDSVTATAIRRQFEDWAKLF